MAEGIELIFHLNKIKIINLFLFSNSEHIK